MKNLLIFLITALMSTSCLTVKRIERNCETFYKVCVQTDQSVVYRDTIVTLPPMPVKLPESTINVDLLIKANAGKLTLPKQQFKRGLITVSVEVKDNRLLVDATIPDSLTVQPEPVIIYKAIREETTTNTVPVKYIPKAYKYAFWLVIIQIVALLAIAGLSTAKFYGINLKKIFSELISKLKK